MAENGGDYRPLRWRSICAASALALVGLASLAAAVTDAYGISLIQSAALRPDKAALGAYLAARTLIGLIEFGAIIVAGILFCIWFYRVNRNVTSFVSTRQSAGWAVASLFVPFAHLYIPARAMKDVWNACARAVDTDAAGNWVKWQRARVPFPVGLWWGTWIAANSLSASSMVLLNNPQDFTALGLGLGTSVASSASATIAAAACVFCILRLSRIQRDLFESPEPIAVAAASAPAARDAA